MPGAPALLRSSSGWRAPDLPTLRRSSSRASWASTEYGVFAYTWVWFLVFSAVATLGFGDSPVRYVAQLRERGEIAHLRGFIRFAPLTMLVASVAFGALLIALLPFAGNFLDHAYLLPMALMAVSIPFACIQSFLEGLGRSYNWTIPALFPVYILRHGLLLTLMGAAVALGFEADGADRFCLPDPHYGPLHRLSGGRDPRPSAQGAGAGRACLPPARMGARVSPFRGALRCAAPLVFRRRARPLLLCQPA